MNILFLSQENPYPPDGGHYIRTYNILKMLAEKHNIFFIAIANDDNRMKHKQRLENLCESVDIFVVPQGKSKWRYLVSLILNLFSTLPFTAQKNYIHDVSVKIKQLLANNKIDLVHVDILPLAIYHKNFDSLPKILVNHNVESLRLYRWIKVEKNTFIKLFLYYQYLKLGHFEKQMCPKFERCMVVSEPDQKILEEMCKTKNFVVLPNGVDVQYFSPLNNTKIITNSLVWVGGMRYAYSADAVDYFLDEILPLIKLEIPDIKVSFIGSSPTSKLVKSAKENPNIKVLGYVDDVRMYIQQAAVFIAPLRSGSGTKIKVLNAMALEKAVVTTSIGAEGIKVKLDEDIMIADTPQEFAEKTIYLLRHPEEAKIMGIKGRKVIEKHYSWESIGMKMYQVYEEVAS
ncbi:MAG: glycosyltransferase [Candidatus Hodarchaeota archaeon]